MIEIILAPTGDVFVRCGPFVVWGPTSDAADNRAILRQMAGSYEVFPNLAAAKAYAQAHDDHELRDAWLEDLAFAHSIIGGKVKLD